MKLKKQPIPEKLGLISRTKWNAQSVSVMVWRLPGTQCGLFSSVLARTKLFTSELLGKGFFFFLRCITVCQSSVFSSPVDIRNCCCDNMPIDPTLDPWDNYKLVSALEFPVDQLRPYHHSHLCLYAHFLKLCLRKALCSTTSQKSTVWGDTVPSNMDKLRGAQGFYIELG